jgi:hypothetical protein
MDNNDNDKRQHQQGQTVGLEINRVSSPKLFGMFVFSSSFFNFTNDVLRVLQMPMPTSATIPATTNGGAPDKLRLEP